MHVFCPDCNAEYKVNERSSLTKTVKFVCIECGNSWTDKFERLEKTKMVASDSEVSNGDDEIDNANTESEKFELNSLALEEVQNSFGNHKNRIDSKNKNTEKDHIFQFETDEVSNEIEEEGPSKTFPKIRSDQGSPIKEQIEERDAKEIEIERRLKESSELLKKAKQPNLENKETIQKESKPKSRKILLTLSILVVVSFFTYNLTILFLEDILREVPFAPEVLSQISLYTAVFKDMFLIIIERILNFIPNLA